MNIVVNSKEIRVKSDMTIAELLSHLCYDGWVTVFLNGNKLLEKGYENTILKEKDIVKIIKPLSGG